MITDWKLSYIPAPKSKNSCPKEDRYPTENVTLADLYQPLSVRFNVSWQSVPAGLGQFVITTLLRRDYQPDSQTFAASHH